MAAGDATWEGWDGEVGVVADEPDLYLLIGGAGGHVPRRSLQITDATDAAARVGLHVPRHWSATEVLVSALRAASRAKKITVRRLAKAIRISRSYASRLLSGKRRPAFGVACRWAHLLGLTLLLSRTEWPADDGGDEPTAARPTTPTRPTSAAEPASDRPMPAAEPASDRPDPPPGVDKPDLPRPESNDAAPSSAPDAAGVAKPDRDSAGGPCERIAGPESVAKPDRDSAGDPCDSIIAPGAVAEPDHSSAIVAKPERDSAAAPGNVAKPDQMSAGGGARKKYRRSSSTSPRSPLFCEGMAVEFRRGDSVRFAFSTEGMDPEAIKREIHATMKLNIAAGTTPYIDGQPFDMTLYHLEMRIDAEAAQRKADILASEQRILAIVEEKIAEVVARIDELSNYTRETIAAVGATQAKMRHELKLTMEKVQGLPELVTAIVREVLHMSRGDQDKKKEKHDGN